MLRSGREPEQGIDEEWARALEVDGAEVEGVELLEEAEEGGGISEVRTEALEGQPGLPGGAGRPQMVCGPAQQQLLGRHVQQRRHILPRSLQHHQLRYRLHAHVLQLRAAKHQPRICPENAQEESFLAEKW